MQKTSKKRDTFLPFAPPLIGQEEKQEVLDTLNSGWITTGPKTERFEKNVCDYVNAQYAVAVNSCTAALHLTIVANNIGDGDEVIMPTYTFASTAHVVLYQRAKPIFVDIDPLTYNISTEQIEAAITPQTKAIMPVHYAGLPCDLEHIYDIAARHNLIVIEDAAHAIGAEYHGRKIGSFGNLTCFSFYATKNITTGEGGMIVTNDKETAEKMRIMSMYGISDARKIWERYAPRGKWFYDIQYLGFKYNMMDIQAALGIHQLKRLDDFIQRRTSIAQKYTASFSEMEEIVTPYLPKESEARHAWHLYTILIKPEKLSINRDEFIEQLSQENIGASVLFRPLHLHSLYQEILGCKRGDYPVSESVYDRTISLPLFPGMSETDVNDVIVAVKKIIKNARK